MGNVGCVSLNAFASGDEIKLTFSRVEMELIQAIPHIRLYQFQRVFIDFSSIPGFQITIIIIKQLVE